MIIFETLDLETCELAWAIWAAGDAPDLDSAAMLAYDIEHLLADYADDWDAALALAQSATA